MEEMSLWKRLILKITSVKTWIVIFINILLTIIIIRQMYEFKELAYIIVAADLGYCGLNVAQKKLEK